MKFFALLSTLTASILLSTVSVECAPDISSEMPALADRYQSFVEAEVDRALKGLGDLDASKRQRYRDIVAKYHEGTLLLRLKLLDLALAKDGKPERKALKKRVERLAKIALAESSEVFEGKDLQVGRAYFRRQQREIHVYEDAAKRWHQFMTRFDATALDEQQLSELKRVMLPFFVDYHKILLDRSGSFRMGPGEPHQEIRKRTYAALSEALKPRRAAVKSLLGADQFKQFNTALSESTAMVMSDSRLEYFRR